MNDVSVEMIFEPDEMNLVRVDPSWDAEALLTRDGIFFLKDVVRPLGLDTAKVIRKAKEMDANTAWKVMGVRKVWNHWAVRMRVFAPFYHDHLKARVEAVGVGWNSNKLLKQKGIFYLSEVCHLIPFSTYQIRYQAKRNPNAEKEFGVWKDHETNRYVVDMEIFSRWIKELWRGNYRRS